MLGSDLYHFPLLYNHGEGIKKTLHHMFNKKGDSVATLYFGTHFEPETKKSAEDKKHSEPEKAPAIEKKKTIVKEEEQKKPD